MTHLIKPTLSLTLRLSWICIFSFQTRSRSFEKRLFASSCRSVRPLAWTDCLEIWCWGLQKSVEKPQILLQSGTVPDDINTFYFCQWHKFTIKALLCSCEYLYIVGSDLWLSSMRYALLSLHCNNGHSTYAPQLTTLYSCTQREDGVT